MNQLTPKDASYEVLLTQIAHTYQRGRATAAQAVNHELLLTYWQMGQHIVEFEQKGQNRAEYGTGLINQLAKDLSVRYGKGFSRSNLIRIRQFYALYASNAKGATASHLLQSRLTWSHIVELLKIDDPIERGFYEQQAIKERWSVRELQRQKTAQLFLRLALNRDKQGIMQLANEGLEVQQPSDLLREPYIFEFLKIPEPYELSELTLEGLLCDHLQSFLLELGKGFTFVGRQYRVTLDNTHYRVDLVFYHRILRCFVLIDLKMGDVQHQDIGQMNMYLGYFAAEENLEGDNPPIGIILSRNKDELLVEYATYQMSSQLFVQKYQLYLPEREELRREIENTLRQMEAK
jgi:predicted nuclease of restriction endonuclease-like (RecB) superfamily